MTRHDTDIRDIFRHAGWTPLRSGAVESGLVAVEQRLGRKLPAAFRELQALDNGTAFLARFSNSDSPISQSKLATHLSRWTNYDPLSENILPFMIENQAVCVWGIRLDEEDDPPVVVEVDSGTPPHWQRCADAFTDWLECQVSDHALTQSCWFAAQAPPLEAGVLSLLCQRFEKGLQTYAWPGKTNYRFGNARSQLLLRNADRQCDWWIAPKSAELVAATLDELEEIGGIGTNLYAIQTQGEDALHSWRDLRKGA